MAFAAHSDIDIVEVVLTTLVSKEIIERYDHPPMIAIGT